MYIFREEEGGKCKFDVKFRNFWQMKDISFGKSHMEMYHLRNFS